MAANGSRARVANTRITADRRRFTKRTVRIGLQQDGYRQILEGLQPGELVATEGALFLSNALATASR